MNKKKEIFFGIATWALIFLMLGFLFGCAKQSPVETAFNDAQQALISAKQTLPIECQTPETLEKFNVIEAKYEKAQSVCELKIKDLETKYERSLLALFLIIGAFCVKFFIKK